MQCRVCWEADGDIYQLPCKCKGSVGTVHLSCFVHTMLLRYQVGQGGCCDVCKTRIPFSPGIDVVHFHCLCYNISFIVLFYLLSACLCCVLWLQEFDTLAPTERNRSIIQFSAILVILQPTLYIATYVFISLHMILHGAPAASGESAETSYRHYLTTHGHVILST